MAYVTLINQTNSPIDIGGNLFGVAVAASAELSGTDLQIAEVYRDSGLASMSVTSAPANTEAPTISGTPQVGEVLSGDFGEWTGSPEIENAWQISANGTSGWADIAGATAATYTPVAGDATKFIRLAVTAENAAGQAVAYSAAVGPVEAAE